MLQTPGYEHSFVLLSRIPTSLNSLHKIPVCHLINLHIYIFAYLYISKKQIDNNRLDDRQTDRQRCNSKVSSSWKYR